MAEKSINATVYLCFGLNGLNTPMEEIDAVLKKHDNNILYLKEKNGKREWEYSDKLCFKPNKSGRSKIKAYYDRATGFQLNPREIFAGEEFSRTEIKHQITSQINAERHIKDRMQTKTLNGIQTLLGAIYLISAVLIIVGLFLFSNTVSNIHFTVSYQNFTAIATQTNPFNGIAGIGKALAIP